MVIDFPMSRGKSPAGQGTADYNFFIACVAQCKITGYDIIAEKGVHLGAQMDSRNRVAAYYVIDECLESLANRIKIAFNSIDIVNSDGKSLKVKDLYYKFSKR